MELQAVNVSRRFFRGSGEANYFYAVKDCSLTLSPGKLIELTGRSGSGKSTLLNMLAGLLEPSDGEILLDGKNLYTLSDEERSSYRGTHIGLIPQSHAALHALDVMDNVRLPASIAGETVSDEDVLALLERVGITALKDAYPDELSGGELRRLSIARALVRKPAFLLADEPTGDLDDENTDAVLHLLRKSAADGCGVLLVTHEEKAAAYADEVYRMDGGVLT